MVWISLGIPLSVPELKFLLVGERLGDGFIMYRDLYDHTGPFAAFVYKWLDLIFGRSRWVHLICSTILVIFQAGFFNNILLRNKAYNENTYVPAFLYVVLMCGTFDFFALSPQLMSLTFILLSLNHVFRRIDNVVTDELFLYSGVYLGIATGFYLPSIIFIVVFLMSFILFTTSVVRRLLIFIYGSVSVFVITWGYFFWYGAAGDFLYSFFWAGLTKPNQPLITYMSFLESGYVLGIVALISFTVLFTLRLTNFQQKMQQVMVLLFLGSILIILFSKELSTLDLVLFIPSITFFLVYFIFSLRKKIWRFSLPYLIIFSLLLYPFFWKDRMAPSALWLDDNEEITFHDQRLMGIGVSVNEFRDNKLAGPFLDPYLSQKKLEQLYYFHGASELYKVISESSPEIIEDRWGIVPQLFEQFPKLRNSYHQTGDTTYIRIATQP